MNFKSYIMDSDAVGRALARISHEIVESTPDASEICLIGIMRRGAPLADVLAQKVRSLGPEVRVGYLDITLYRDDLTRDETAPRVNKSEIDFDVTGKTVIMVDDVLFTGRTARAAMEAIISIGRPEKIQFAALIDRGHRELPIRPDFVGKNVPTSQAEVITVRLRETDGETCVKLLER